MKTSQIILSAVTFLLTTVVSASDFVTSEFRETTPSKLVGIEKNLELGEELGFRGIVSKTGEYSFNFNGTDIYCKIPHINLYPHIIDINSYNLWGSTYGIPTLQQYDFMDYLRGDSPETPRFKETKEILEKKYGKIGEYEPTNLLFAIGANECKAPVESKENSRNLILFKNILNSTRETGIVYEPSTVVKPFTDALNDKIGEKLGFRGIDKLNSALFNYKDTLIFCKHYEWSDYTGLQDFVRYSLNEINVKSCVGLINDDKDRYNLVEFKQILPHYNLAYSSCRNLDGEESIQEVSSFPKDAKKILDLDDHKRYQEFQKDDTIYRCKMNF